MCFVACVLFLDKTVISFTGVDICFVFLKRSDGKDRPKKYGKAGKIARGEFMSRTFCSPPRPAIGAAACQPLGPRLLAN